MPNTGRISTLKQLAKKEAELQKKIKKGREINKKIDEISINSKIIKILEKSERAPRDVSSREQKKSQLLSEIHEITDIKSDLYWEEKIKELWAITTFFNPSHWNIRYQNYQRFREGSKKQGLNLIAVELSFNDEFELKDDDADIIIKLTSDSILWQKERLLNLALNKLPMECTKVCWIDADLIFDNDQWVYQTSKLLDVYPVIQPFQRAFRLPKNGDPKEFSHLEIRADSHAGIIYDYKLKDRYNPGKQCGYAWAIRRSIIDQIGFYDRNIIGGGDRIMCRAIFYPELDFSKKYHQPKSPYTKAHAKDIEKYMERLHNLIDRQVHFVPGVVYHMWHGDYTLRKYAARHFILKKYNYDPRKDIKVSKEGCWVWDTNKKKLKNKVKEYFDSRREDD